MRSTLKGVVEEEVTVAVQAVVLRAVTVIWLEMAHSGTLRTGRYKGSVARRRAGLCGL